MYAKAKYFRGKFIRNGIGWMVVLAVFSFPSSHTVFFKGITKLTLLVIALSWIVLSYWLNKKIKAKEARISQTEFEIATVDNTYKYVDTFFSVFVMLAVVFSNHEFEYARTIVSATIGAGFAWYYLQIKGLNKYLSS